MNNFRIVKIGISDTQQLLEVARQTFIETFSPMNTPENMSVYLNSNFALEKLEEEINNVNSEFYFATQSDSVIGYLKLNSGPAQTELNENNTLEIERIYVLKEYQGLKIGQMLFERALAIARLRGVDYIWLGVWEKNLKAIQFYKKNGFIEFGKHVFKLGTDEQTDIMMRLHLKPL